MTGLSGALAGPFPPCSSVMPVDWAREFKGADKKKVKRMRRPNKVFKVSGIRKLLGVISTSDESLSFSSEGFVRSVFDVR